MLMSRVFALMLGTTLFVLIWSCQDGDRLQARSQIEVQNGSFEQPVKQVRPLLIQTVSQSTVKAVSAGSCEKTCSVRSTSTTDPVMWVFAEEQSTTQSSDHLAQQ